MLKWIDTLDIAIELYEKHPEIDPQWVNFMDLRQLVIDLEDFSDDPGKSNEKFLSQFSLIGSKKRSKKCKQHCQS